MLSKSEFTKKVGQRLQKLRQTKGMNQEELAHAADLYRTYVGHVENGRYSPSGYVLYKLIEALKIDPNELLKV